MDLTHELIWPPEFRSPSDKPITTAEFLRDNYPMVVPQIEAAKGNKAQ